MGHVVWEAVQRRPLLERVLELGRVNCRDLRRIERADPLAQLQRPGEGLLERHLLVEYEADQQRIGISFEETICSVVAREREQRRLAIKRGSSDGVSSKMQALLHISRTVARDPFDLTATDTQAALDAGATDGDVQLAVLIAAAFCMYNRIVEGFRARTLPTEEAYRGRAAQIAEFGYSSRQVTSIPG